MPAASPLVQMKYKSFQYVYQKRQHAVITGVLLIPIPNSILCKPQELAQLCLLLDVQAIGHA